MALTLTDLQEKLKQIDEISLMEVLEITSEDIVQRFQDRVELKYEELSSDFDDDLEEEEFYENFIFNDHDE